MEHILEAVITAEAEVIKAETSEEKDALDG
jgi:hypothetical protein